MDRPWAVGELVEIDDLGGAAKPGAPVYADKQLVVSRTLRPIGITFAGEIDATNSHSVASSIAAAEPGLDLHIDVTHLLFIDISGIRAFVSAAENLKPGRRLLLHGMPPQLETVIRVVGWNRLPTLVVCECGIDQR